MKKNKLWMLLAAFAAVVLVLAACGNDEPDPTPEPDVVDTVTPELPTDEPVEPGQEIVLTYANWNLGTAEENNIERRMIQAFMDAHPGIIVEIHEDVSAGDGPWEERLAIAASIGNLPDVFMVNDIGFSMAGGWAYDLTAIANADADFSALPAGMRDAMAVNGVVYMVPFAQHMFGYFVNTDLFDSLNLDAPTHGFSVDELEAAIRATTDVPAGRIGTNHVNYFTAWGPGALNNNLGFFTFDGDSTFHVDAPEMVTALNLALELNTNGFVCEGFPYDERPELFGHGWCGAVFFDGNLGLMWDGTWAVGGINDQADFNWEFIGVPGGRPMVTLDVLNVASTTAHAEAAFLLANWMGSGTAGFTRRMEIAAEMGTIINAIPISGNQAMLDQFWGMLGVDGIAVAYENMANALIDPNKVTPGWRDTRFYTDTGVAIGDNENANTWYFFYRSPQGRVNFADYLTRVNQAMQARFEDVRSNLLD